MNESVRIKLLKIFAGGESLNEVYEQKDGKYVLIRLRKGPSQRKEEKEEMRRVEEELSQNVNN
jgi:hypothetical protein